MSEKIINLKPIHIKFQFIMYVAIFYSFNFIYENSKFLYKHKIYSDQNVI